MFKERAPLVMMALLALATPGVEVAAGQERKPGLPARVLQPPAPITGLAKAELTCTAFASRDEAGTQPIANNRLLATDASQVWVHRSVKNTGQATAGTFPAEIKITGYYSSEVFLPYQQETVGPLPPGGSHAWPAIPVPLEPGENTISVWTRYDYPDSVDESDEHNVCQAGVNAQTPPPEKPKDQVASQAAQQTAPAAAQAITPSDEEEPGPGLPLKTGFKALLTPAPDVTCTAWVTRNSDGRGVIPNGSQVENQERVYVHVTVRNLGQAEAKNFHTRIQIKDGDPDSENGPWNAFMTLEPGLTYRFPPREVLAISQTGTPYMTGSAAAEVVTDIFQVLHEANESNNECSVAVSFRDLIGESPF